MKLLKPAQLYTILLGILFICFTWAFFAHLWNYKEKFRRSSSQSNRLQDIDFSRNPFLMDSKVGPDPFIKGSFLNKKLLQLVSLTHNAANSNSLLKNNSSQANSIDFSYLLDELMVAAKLKNYFSKLWGCKDASKVQVQETVYDGRNSVIYSGLYQSRSVRVEVAKADIDTLVTAKCGSSDSDHSQLNLDRCFLLKNRKVMDEAMLLIQLSHANIVRILGFCIQRLNPVAKVSGGKLSSAGVILVKDSGPPARIEKLKMSSWENRVKVCAELLNLAIYFTNTPLGSIRLDKWHPENFIFNSVNGKIQLNSFDHLISISEPQCKSDEQCFIDGINCGLKCTFNTCVGYNAKRNLFELNQAFLSSILRFNVPQRFADNALNILVGLSNLKLSASEALSAIRPLMSRDPSRGISPENAEIVEKNPAVLSMQRLPDGSLVDSWEQHEAKVAINEVNFMDVEKPPAIQVNELEPPVEIKHVTEDWFQRIENADYPGRYDYYCPYSKAEWGCVMSLQTVEAAMQKCLADKKCKAFVTIPHLRKEGWIIAILKSDNSNPVDHTGTTVYVRRNTDSAHVQTPQELPLDDAVELKEHVDCLHEVINLQKKRRSESEKSLMKACGWSLLTDDEWQIAVKEGSIADASTFKPSRGKLASGGQMNVVLSYNSKSYPALFLAKRGPEEFDVSQLAVYQLDRMLGLYKTIPALERLLTASELMKAGFPVDVGGNKFDKFRPLKQSDDSLLGVIVPQIPERVTITHYLTVPRLSGITNAVTPFNKRQWDDMEYLLLGFLAAIPLSSKGHQSVQGRLLHVRTETAFLHSSNDYISYFYNCQFPAHVIQTLRHSMARHCDMASAIRTRLIDSTSPPIGDVLRSNLAQLLELVDRCIARFGKQVVLYEAGASVKRR